jgi:hypothetical protein
MTFWPEVLAIFLGDVFASALFVSSYVIIQWFLRATDVTVGYSWKWVGQDFHPCFDIRNRSGSKTYLLANIAYTKKNGKELLFIDNKSIWGVELRPGSITWPEGDPVRGVNSVSDSIETEVSVRLQNGRLFWLKGQGPGQLRMGRVQRIAFWLRDKIEKSAFPFE